MRIDAVFYACFWTLVSAVVLVPIYIVSWAAMKKLSPCKQEHRANKACSKCNSLGFVWPWQDE